MKRLVLNLIEKKSGNLHLSYEWYDSKPIEGEEKQSQEEFKKSVLQYFKKLNKDDLFIVEEMEIEEEDIPKISREEILKSLKENEVESAKTLSSLKEAIKKLIDNL